MTRQILLSKASHITLLVMLYAFFILPKDAQAQRELRVSDASQEEQIILVSAKNKGEWIGLNIKADGEVKVEGASYDSPGYYMLEEQTITITGQVKNLDCSSNGLISVDASKAKSLEQLLVDDNEITSITLGSLPRLVRLYVGSNHLTSIDLSGLPELADFSCWGNQLTTIDLSHNGNLRSFVCRDNLFVGSLDLTHNPLLRELSCYNNQISEIKLSSPNNLGHLEIQRNKISGDAMTQLLTALPEYRAFPADEWDDYMGYNLQGIYLVEKTTKEGNRAYQDDVAIATAKGWPVYWMDIEKYGEEKPQPYNGESRPSFDTSNLVKLLIKPNATELKFVYRLSSPDATAQVDLGGGETATLSQIDANELQTFTHTFAQSSSELRTVTITAEDLVTLRIVSSKAVSGVSQITAPVLERFNCDYTPLMDSEELDFSNCPKLEEITLNGAEVARVILPPDRSRLKTFQWATPLFATSTSRQLESLDLSGCRALDNLSLQGTTLHTIDLSDTPLLTTLVITGLDSKNYPRKLIGGKALKHLEMVTLQYCAYTYDMLPDLNETPLDNFKVNKMYFAHVDRSQYRGMTVDLSNMATTQGLAEGVQPTTFIWYYKDSNKKWQEIPLDKITEDDKAGSFTFSESLLDPTTQQITIRAKIFNTGYPDLAFYKDGLYTYNITLPYLPNTMRLTVTDESPGEDEDGYEIEELDLSIQVGVAEAETPIYVDWGDGQRKEYTIPKGDEPFTLSQTVDLGATIKLYGPVTLVDASGSKLVDVAFDDATTIQTLRLSRNKIEQIDLSHLPNLKELQITDNRLTDLPLDSTPLLEELYCGYNQFTQLSVESTPRLTVLNCNDNQITSLDLTALPDLEIAVLSGNAFGDDLDMSGNKQLRILDIEHCQLSVVELESEYLERVKVNGNKLTELQLIPYPSVATHLYNLDVRDNSFTACDLNDLLIQLPPAGDTSEGQYRLQLSGTPGATAYDTNLLNGWIADSKSNSEGCETAKIFDASTLPQYGHAYIEAGDEQYQFAEPIKRPAAGSIVLVPDAGYIPDYCKWGHSTLSPEDAEGSRYFFMLQNNTFVTYGFKKDNGVTPVTDRPNVWIITPSEIGWDIETPYPETSYLLYDLAGQTRASGTTDTMGHLSCELPSGAYILSIAGATIQLIR